MHYHKITTRALLLMLPALFMVVLACSTTNPAEKITDDDATLQVRRHLATTPIENDPGNPSCLSLVEREGPRSIQWLVSRPDSETVRVDVQRGGTQLRDFAWLIDADSKEITSLSALC